MAKKYTLNVNKRGSRPRSERLRKLGGAAVSDGGSTVVNVTSSLGGSGDIYSHTHTNKSVLDKITIDEGSYLYVDQLRETEDGAEYVTCTEKVKSGFSDEAGHAAEASHADEADHANNADEAKHAEEADNAEMWDKHKFDDYIDQPVRKTDTVQHKELITDTLRGANQFVDGLLGSGYRLWQDDEGRVHLTLDKLTVRQSMVVLELLIERIRSVGGQIVVSAANGKIKTVEELEEYYRVTFEQDNQFFPHDLIRCQVFAGGTTKGYWVEVADVVGAAVLVAKGEFEGSVPEVGDECVLMGNTEDPERQNLILISATEDGHPRIDVMNGVKSKSFAGCLRARFGSLEGINDDSFPTDKQPQGYGLYSDNAYLRGTFLLETGEDIKTKFEITEGKIQAAVTGIRQDFLGENGYLNNAAFADGLDKWSTENETVFFLVGNKWIWANNKALSKKGDSASVTTDNGRTVVRIRDKFILQKNGNLREKPEMRVNTEGLKEALPVYLSFYYRCAEPGTLKVSFEGVDKSGFVEFDSLNIEEQLEATGNNYEQYTCNGLWNGTGDFKLSFSGDIYMYMLVLSTDKVEAFAYQYKTLFEQSDRLAKISAAVYDKDENALQETGLFVKPEGAGLYAQDVDGNVALIGVTVDETDEDGNKIGSTIKLTADNIQLEGVVTANGNFKILEDGSIETIKGKIGDLFIDADCLYYGDVTDWTSEEQKTLISAGRIRLQNYLEDNKYGRWALHQLFVGSGADPNEDDNATFMYLRKDQQQGSDIASLYRPAFRIKSALADTLPFVSMLSTGSIVINRGGLIQAGFIKDVTTELPMIQRYSINWMDGLVQVLKNTSGAVRTVYVDVCDEFLNWIFGQNTTDYAVILTLVGHNSNNGNININLGANTTLIGASSITIKANSVVKLLILRNGEYSSTNNPFYCLYSQNL